MKKSIYIWKSDYLHSLEYVIIYNEKTIWNFESTVILTPENDSCYKIIYSLLIDKNWKFLSALIKLDNLGMEKKILIELDEDNIWYYNNKVRIDLKGCTEIDLGFSPLTNTLPIRRLSLNQSESKKITVAWVQFPSFEVKSLDQKYTNINNLKYLYESGSNFKAFLNIDENGFVTKYEKYWSLVNSSREI